MSWIHPGKELESLKNAIYSFTLDVIAIPKEEQKVKTLVDLAKLGPQSSMHPRKGIRKFSKNHF